MTKLSTAEQFVAGLPATEYHIEALVADPQARWHVTDAERDIMLGTAICRPGRAVGPHRPLIAALQWLGRKDNSGDIVSMYGLRYYDGDSLVAWPANSDSADAVAFTECRRGEIMAGERNFHAALHIAALLEYAQPLHTEPWVMDRYIDVVSVLADQARPFAP
jgi:hypothetical protein